MVSLEVSNLKKCYVHYEKLSENKVVYVQPLIRIPALNILEQKCATAKKCCT